MKKFHNLQPLFLNTCDSCGGDLADKTEVLCPACKARRGPYSISAYAFGDCPKCGRRRPLHPDSGLCWDCGGHCLDPRPASLGKTLTAEERAMSAVDPVLKSRIEEVDAWIERAGEKQAWLRLVEIRKALERKI